MILRGVPGLLSLHLSVSFPSCAKHVFFHHAPASMIFQLTNCAQQYGGGRLHLETPEIPSPNKSFVFFHCCLRYLGKSDEKVASVCIEPTFPPYLCVSCMSPLDSHTWKKLKRKNKYPGINTWQSRTDKGCKQQIFSNNLSTFRLELGLAVKLIQRKIHAQRKEIIK